MNLFANITIGIVFLVMGVLGVLVGYFLHRYQAEKALQNQ